MQPVRFGRDTARARLDLVHDLRATDRREPVRLRQARDDVLRSKALVLDDAGAEFADASGSYRVDLDELVDRFYADARALVITTNLVYATPRQRDEAVRAAKERGESADADVPTFTDRYGERVTDRIRECGRWVSSRGGSQRRSQP